MARRVFFSFHYDRDAWRAGIVRNSWVARAGREASPFLDKADWEAIKRSGNDAIKRWIDQQMNGTSVTVVLIGAATAGREWVKYEIRKSYEDGKGLLGVYIHGLQNQERRTDTVGKNPFDDFTVRDKGPLSSEVMTYDWVRNNGYDNFAGWVESAARAVGR